MKVKKIMMIMKSIGKTKCTTALKMMRRGGGKGQDRGRDRGRGGRAAPSFNISGGNVTILWGGMPQRQRERPAQRLR